MAHCDLPVPLDWNDLIVGAHIRARHDSDTVWDLQSAARVRHEHRRDRARIVHLARRALCVFFAFQRYFVQGLLAGSVK